jgi:hypothetical protein
MEAVFPHQTHEDHRIKRGLGRLYPHASGDDAPIRA